MFSRKSKSKAIWQNKYLKEVFSIGKKFNQNYTRTILNNSSILDKKDEYYFPNLLYKFYAPTSDNILDIKNKRLWMAHLSSFNDPFDCCIGFDEEAYEKYCLLKIISSQEMTSRKEESEKFTNDEITRLEQSIYNALNNEKSNTNAVDGLKRITINIINKSKYSISNFLN
ncbi:hypothetical protein SOV_37020 [Sporomusa ovata DSM 2662]|uniref:Uncharacterized protein n=1 Tax=Sporomusa ovata TaxID=2378 RepID=A0A0U1L670_9FIRM|nr:hypothetical protein [Sporomusa ovata]EQB24851.1 hypothetical protein SOV_6c02650 [Sporomusa ovata DSM 2662]CQR75198.1 hypothetical protein SpAn4DRAFT_4562 [Sporomusa ovata]